MTLEEAVAVPQALMRNGGQPMTVIDLATALGKSPGSSFIRTITASGSAYGVSGGSYRTTIQMADLGSAITQPKSSDEAAKALVTAALTPKTFRAIYDFYKGKKFPEKQFFINTVVREFGVDLKQAEKCCAVFAANMRFVGLIKPTPGGDWLGTEATPQATATVVNEADVAEAEEEAASIDDAAGSEEAVEVELHLLRSHPKGVGRTGSSSATVRATSRCNS